MHPFIQFCEFKPICKSGSCDKSGDNFVLKEAAHGGSAIPWQPADPGEQAQPWIQSVKNQFNILDLLCRPYQILS